MLVITISSTGFIQQKSENNASHYILERATKLNRHWIGYVTTQRVLTDDSLGLECGNVRDEVQKRWLDHIRIIASTKCEQVVQYQNKWENIEDA